jgi:O-antigen biosynthesis protein
MTTDRTAVLATSLAAVVQSYRIALARSPEPEAVRHWTQFLKDGHSLQEMVADIAASAEFANLNGPPRKSDFNAIRNLFRRSAGGKLTRAEKAQVVSSWLLRRSAEKVTFRLCRSKLSRSEGLLFPLLYPLGANPQDDVAYRYWVADFERRLQALPASQSAPGPLVTLMLDATAADVRLLQDTIGSVLGQLYPQWELLVAGACPSAQESLLPICGGHSNVKWLHSEAPAEPSAIALSAASGDFVAWLDAGDRLSPWALSEVVRALQKQPQAVLVYTDEDLVDDQGLLSSPVFKTAWSPDLLLAGDCVGSLAVLRRDCIERLGPVGESVLPQRFDLLLRLLYDVDPEMVLHVPGPHYHRRLLDRRSPGRFPEQLANVGTPHLKSALVRFHTENATGIVLKSSLLGGRMWPRPVFPLPDPAPLVSIIIPTRDLPELLGPCVNGILHRTDYPNLEVLIIDNDSSAIGTRILFTQLTADPRVRVLPFPGEFNWSAANNFGAEAARGSVLLFLNNDIEITNPSWLRELVSHAVRPSVGAVGAKLYYKDGRLQHGGMLLDGQGNCIHVYRFADPDEPGFLGQLALVRDVSSVTGACMAIRKDVFTMLKGFEPHHLKVTWSDVDLCFRARACKLRIVWTPFAELRHLECASRGKDISPERIGRFLREQRYMQETWGHQLRDDPFVNPCLTAAESGLLLSPSVGARWFG